MRVVDCPLVVGEGADKKELIKVTYHDVRRWRARCYNRCERYRENFHTKTYPKLTHTRAQYKLGRKRENTYFEQEHAILDPHKTVLEEIMDRYPRLSEQQARSVLGAVLLTGEKCSSLFLFSAVAKGQSFALP